MALLRERCEVTVNPRDRVLTRAELLKGVKGQDALLPLLTDTIDAAVMDAEPKLRIIANYAVGFNNVDVAAATVRKIPVTNTPGVLTDTTADMAWALLMTCARRIVEGDRFTRAGRYTGWAPLLLLGHDVHGKTLGVIGFGRIGQAVARRAGGFGMRILYHDVHPNESAARELGATFVDMPTLLRESDYLSLHTVLSPETTHLINAERLRQMKRTAILINTSRGPVVDERALVRALKAGWIAGAGLDVYEWEPRLAAGLAKLPNAVLAPHIASATLETRSRMAVMAAENVIARLEGRRPPNLVNPDVLS